VIKVKLVIKKLEKRIAPARIIATGGGGTNATGGGGTGD